MGTAGAARVDTVVVHAIAREYETAAAILDGVLRSRLNGLEFGGATAGRAHAAHGDAVRGALFGLTTALREWSRAAAEIATVLHGSADRYHAADLRAAERVG
ncbi:type VII secretion target [Mycobacterium sp. smrl_JER01]|uniref:type VII secretion target n=1 Tax=Mycobacterium sp. smrl_JER01 TaxID=3402633 RepID=UPI003AC9BD3B